MKTKRASRAQLRVADERRAGAPIAVCIASPEWEPAVGPVGTLKKQLTAHVDGAQIGRLLLYREVDGRFDISGIAVKDEYHGRRVATQLLDFAFVETGADHFTLSTGTTGDGTALVNSYGEGRRAGRRVVERPTRLGLAPVGDEHDVERDEVEEQDEVFSAPR